MRDSLLQFGEHGRMIFGLAVTVIEKETVEQGVVPKQDGGQELGSTEDGEQYLETGRLGQQSVKRLAVQTACEAFKRIEGLIGGGAGQGCVG